MPNLADLLSLHREAIAASWTERAQQLPNTHYRTVPLDDLRVWLLQGLDALIAAMTTHSDESLDKYLFDIGRRRLLMEFDIREVIEALLLCKEAVLPLIWRSFVPGSTEAYEAVNELDGHVRHVIGRFGHLYAEMMLLQVREQQQRTDLMLDAAERASHSPEPDQILSPL
ncbi:MAG TPA: RsbRD N-terminal domain-containing protein, partial [Aggregatilineaceae bacterium]|nr:RsbRD N-terminal domain-containing protein [Aggregatilineaceae bacterium]